MRILAQFSSRATSEQLRAVLAAPAVLSSLPTLRDVQRVDPMTLSMVFTPSVGLGPIPLATTVVTLIEDDNWVEFVVNARYHSHVVDVTLRVEVSPADDGNVVAWAADVTVRGAAASVGQRVIIDLATRAIGDVLVHAAAAAVRSATDDAGDPREASA